MPPNDLEWFSVIALLRVRVNPNNFTNFKVWPREKGFFVLLILNSTD